MPTLPIGTGGGTLSPVGTALSRSSGLRVSKTGDEISKESVGVCSSGGGAGMAEGLSSDVVGA